jgi:TRAP-type C4-dicarboxylate transport system permease small subunit
MNINFNKLRSVIENMFGVAGILLIIIETYSVFSRNIFKMSAAWTNEVLRLIFLWTVFIVAALAFFDDQMISIELLEEKLERQRKKYGLIKLIQYIIALGFFVSLLQQSIQVVTSQMATGATTEVLFIPHWIINTGFIIGNILLVIFAIYKIITYRMRRYH